MFANWVYELQGLIGGILALVAAIGSMFWIHSHRSDSIRRKNIADRAGMTRALSDVIQYSRDSIYYIHELHQAWSANRNGRPFTPNNNCPEYPQEAFEKIQNVIEHATKEDSSIMLEFLSLSQVQHARMGGFLSDLNRTNPNGRHLVFTESNFHDAIFDAIGIYKFAERLFGYARMQTLNIGEMCSGREANNTLFVSFGLNEQDLLDLIERRWPPEISPVLR